MRACEFIKESTTASSIATVAQPLGVITRTVNYTPTKYANSAVIQKRKKKHVSR